MGRVQSTVLIDAAPDAVWEVLNDTDRWPEWIDFTEKVTYVSDESFREGTVYREIAGPGPLSSESEWRVTEFDPPRRQVHRSDLGIGKVVITFELDPADGYTRVHQTYDFEVLPQFRPLGWLLERLIVRWLIQRGVNRTLSGLKRVVEEGKR